jgi:hypothetical protein
MLAPLYRLLGRLGWLVVALFLFLFFAATALTALYYYLSEHMPAWAAMAIVALLAGLGAAIAALLGTRSTRRKSKLQAAVATAAPQVGWDALLRRAVSQDPVGAAIAAVAAGILIESIPQLSALVRRVSGMTRPPTVH